jgi:RNA polymerase sigma-70 factor (ECF subfamily)
MRIEELIDLYGDGILRLCILYLGDRHLAEDAFQETFIKAWKKRDEFRGESSVKTWLTRIAINTCRDMLRSGWFRTMRRSQPVETLFDLATDEDIQEEAAVRDALTRLPGLYREVVLLHYDQGLKIREIAKALGLSQNTVSTRLRRARALMEKELKEGIDE